VYNMTNEDINTKLLNLDHESHEPTPAPTVRTWAPKPETQRTSPWWVPLLVPAMMTVLFVIGSIGDHGQPQTQRYTLAGDTFAWLFVLATLAVPAFYAGVRHNRQRGERDPR
jgi:hypothetical protein